MCSACGLLFASPMRGATRLPAATRRFVSRPAIRCSRRSKRPTWSLREIRTPGRMSSLRCHRPRRGPCFGERSETRRVNGNSNFSDAFDYLSSGLLRTEPTLAEIVDQSVGRSNRGVERRAMSQAPVCGHDCGWLGDARTPSSSAGKGNLCSRFMTLAGRCFHKSYRSGCPPGVTIPGSDNPAVLRSPVSGATKSSNQLSQGGIFHVQESTESSEGVACNVCGRLAAEHVDAACCTHCRGCDERTG